MAFFFKNVLSYDKHIESKVYSREGKIMTKNKYLKISYYLTLFIFAVMAFITWSIKTDLETFIQIQTATENEALGNSFMIFAVSCGFLLLTLLIKKIAIKYERNRVTAFVIFFDAICVAFFVILLREAIPFIIAGQIKGYIFEITVLLLSALTLISDLLSLPAERWG